MKTKPYLWMAACFAAASVGLAGQKVDRSELPAPVQATINTAGQAKSIEEITLRQDDGRDVYVVKFAENNAPDSELLVAADGTIVTDASELHAAGDGSAHASISTSTAPATTTAGTTTATAATPAGNTVAVAEDDEVLVDTESMLQLADLPAAVQEAIKREADGREIADIDQETSDDVKVYEVEFREQGINQQIHLNEDGTLVRDDGAIRRTARNLFNGTQVNDTPAAVQDVIQRELEGREIADIDKERRSGRVVYEIEVDDSEGQFQLHVAEDGTVVKDGRIAAE